MRGVHRPKPSFRTNQHLGAARAGYTLLEVILAIGVSATLLLAIYSTTSMYYVQIAAGRERAERAQLLRGLTMQLRRDLAATYTAWNTKPPSAASLSGSDGSADDSNNAAAGTSADTMSDAAGSASSSSSSSASASSTTETSASELEWLPSEFDPPTGGVYGTETTLSVIACLPPQMVASPILQWGGATGPVGDLVLIRYSLSLDEEPTTQGLIRQEFHQLPDGAGSLANSEFDHRQVLAPEVRSLRFEYFDGTGWQNYWDDSFGGPPRAIAVTLEIQQVWQLEAARSLPNGNLVAVQDLVEPIRLVIALATPPPTPAASDESSDTSGETTAGDSSSDSSGNDSSNSNEESSTANGNTDGSSSDTGTSTSNSSTSDSNNQSTPNPSRATTQPGENRGSTNGPIDNGPMSPNPGRGPSR